MGRTASRAGDLGLAAVISPASPADLGRCCLEGFCPTLSPDAQLYLRPLALVPAGLAPPFSLAGGIFGFSWAELIVRERAEAETRHTQRITAPLAEILSWGERRGPWAQARLSHLTAALTRPRPPLLGWSLDRPRLMGVINVTPDSFSDGGTTLDPWRAIARGRTLRAAGAEILDIGGESSRPGAVPLSSAQESARVVPVIAALAEEGACLSIDTRHAAVMAAAHAAGATLINDITALTGDPDSLAFVASTDAPVVLMHIRGEPQTMQIAPRYDDAALDVFDWLEARVTACLAAGIPLDRLVVDPGIGFGKSLNHNLDILRQLTLYHGLGAPLLLGVSRKSFIARLSRGESPQSRLPGTLAACLAALNQGAHILRVHDVAEFFQARAVWEALQEPAPGTR